MMTIAMVYQGHLRPPPMQCLSKVARGPTHLWVEVSLKDAVLSKAYEEASKLVQMDILSFCIVFGTYLNMLVNTTHLSTNLSFTLAFLKTFAHLESNYYLLYVDLKRY